MAKDQLTFNDLPTVVGELCDRIAKKDNIPVIKQGKHLYIYRDELDKWLESSRKTPPVQSFEEENEALIASYRRGFYPNPRNAPCIKRLHALPKVVGYTLVTRFYTSKSASMNVLSMNLYTANVTSFSGACKLLSLNIFNSYRLFYLLFFMFATGSEVAQ